MLVLRNVVEWSRRAWIGRQEVFLSCPSHGAIAQGELQRVLRTVVLFRGRAGQRRSSPVQRLPGVLQMLPLDQVSGQ